MIIWVWVDVGKLLQCDWGDFNAQLYKFRWVVCGKVPEASRVRMARAHLRDEKTDRDAAAFRSVIFLLVVNCVQPGAKAHESNRYTDYLLLRTNRFMNAKSRC